MSVSDVESGVGLGWNTANNARPDPNEGFLVGIEEGLKEKISGLRVQDLRAGDNRRLVRVFYRWPQDEVTDQTFPFITLNLLRYYRNSAREHRAGNYSLAYAPANYTLPAEGSNQTLVAREIPLPMDLVFQITAHTRSNTQMREIEFALLMDDRLAPRGAYLGARGFLHKMDVDGPYDASGMDPQPGGRAKRHFRKVWTVTVESELFQSDIDVLPAMISPAISVTPTEQPSP